MRFNQDDPDIIRINPNAPEGGCGTFEQPYSLIKDGLARVKPGQSILLSAGEYIGNVNIEVSGTARNPVRIIAQPGALVTIRSACWFFYDTSDLIVSGLTFVDAPHSAISLIGACGRNRFDSLRFINCGTHKGSACTFYIGGAGGGCNIIENCRFEHVPAGEEKAADNSSIGLMIAQGDIAGGSPIVNMVLRRNFFVNYGYGIILGGDESKNVRCGHIVEYNTLRNCANEGILIKSGDTLVRGNVIEKGGCSALSVQSELDCTVESNRIVDCRSGIIAHGRGHSITGNCLIRCSGGAIRVGGASSAEGSAASNCFIERNTFVDCGDPSAGAGPAVAGVIIDPGTSGIVEKNLIVGIGMPYAIVETVRRGGNTDRERARVGATQFVIRDNYAAGGCSLLEGVGAAWVEFADASADDYGNGCGFGASGWVLRPQGFDPAADETADDDYREASILEDEAGNLVIPGEDEGGCGDLFRKFFALASEEEAGEDDAEAEFSGD